jgi:Tat protein secretion system quality control protein TatD with DNase activity
LIAEKVAELKEKALSEIIEQTEINAANLFGWRAE